jgi:hypothetical protein
LSKQEIAAYCGLFPMKDTQKYWQRYKKRALRYTLHEDLPIFERSCRNIVTKFRIGAFSCYTASTPVFFCAENPEASSKRTFTILEFLQP